MRRGTFLLVIAFMLAATAAHADAIAPTIGMFWPAGCLLLLLAVIPIEAVIARVVTKYDWWTCVKASTLGNAASALVGLPLAAVIMLIPSVFLAFYSEQHDPSSWVESAYIVAYCVPCFIISVLVEGAVAKRFFDEPDEALVDFWALVANLATYSMIVIGLIASILWQRFAGHGVSG